MAEMFKEILNDTLEIHLGGVHEEITDLRTEMNGIKIDLNGLRTDMKQEFKNVRKEMSDGFLGLKNEIGAVHNRIDNESFARHDLEHRIRKVLPKLPEAASR